MKLQLNKPLLFLDIEATGLTIGHDRIVELSMLKVMPDYSTEIKTMRFNPQIPIPEKVVRIHGITDADVADKPTFKQMAGEIVRFIGNADLAGYNSNKFDVPLLVEELMMAETDFEMKGRKLIDVQNIFHYMEPRTLSAAYKFYCNAQIENAHSAEADVKATFEIFNAQLSLYENKEVEDEKGNKVIPVQKDVGKLADLSSRTKNADLAGRIVYDDNGVEVFAFGKHKDKPVEEVFSKEPAYYTWIMKGDFPLYTKRVVTQIRLRMKNK